MHKLSQTRPSLTCGRNGWWKTWGSRKRWSSPLPSFLTQPISIWGSAMLAACLKVWQASYSNNSLLVTLPLTEFFVLWDLKNELSEPPETPPSSFYRSLISRLRMSITDPVSQWVVFSIIFLCPQLSFSDDLGSVWSTTRYKVALRHGIRHTSRNQPCASQIRVLVPQAWRLDKPHTEVSFVDHHDNRCGI